jgi:mono/diheme cytochrome c family protein
MSEPEDSTFDPAGISDEGLLTGHEKLLDKQPDERARYNLLPLGLLFFFSGLILFAATYLNRYSGHFDPTIFDENALPLPKGQAAEVKVDPVALGKKVFSNPTYCVQCHQATGLGLPGTYPPLAGSEWVNGPEARVISIVLYGLQGSVHVQGKTFAAAAMPSFGPSGFNLNDQQIAAVLTYVRQEWGNKSGPVAPEQVAAVRAKDGNRGAWAESDLLQIK